METTYVAALADLVDSRGAADRADLQARLRRAVRAWTEEWTRATGSDPIGGADEASHRRDGPVAAGPEITAGDEVQLLLRATPPHAPGVRVLAFLTRLSEALRPDRVLFGVGIGALSTPLGSRVGENDGPCFHRAREALERAKHEGRWAVVEGAAPPIADAANALLRLAGDLRAGWTDRQQEIIRLARTATYRKDVAQQLGVSPSVVTEVLAAARYEAIREAEDAVQRLLDATTTAEVPR